MNSTRDGDASAQIVMEGFHRHPLAAWARRLDDAAWRSHGEWGNDLVLVRRSRQRELLILVMVVLGSRLPLRSCRCEVNGEARRWRTGRAAMGHAARSTHRSGADRDHIKR